MLNNKSNKQGAKPKPKANNRRPRQQAVAKRRNTQQRSVIAHVPARVVDPHTLDNTSARACERAFLLARLDPLNYKGELPCAIGYEPSQTFATCTKARMQMTIGAKGVGYAAMSPYRAGANDTKTFFVSDAGYNDGGVETSALVDPNIIISPGTGAFFSKAEMSASESGSASKSYRVVAAGIRLTPTSPITSISGAVYNWQNSQHTSADGPDAVPQAEIVDNFNRPVIVVNGDQKSVEYRWVPPSVNTGDWVNPGIYTVDTGITDAIMVAGATAGTTWLAEFVVYGEYRSHAFSSLSKPSHSHRALADEVNQYSVKKPVDLRSQGSETTFEKIWKGVGGIAHFIGPIARDLFAHTLSKGTGLPALKSNVQPRLLQIGMTRGSVEEID